MEEHREPMSDPDVVEAGGSVQSVVQKFLPVISNIN